VARRKNILSVDGNFAVREALVHALEMENYRVLHAAKGQKTVRSFLNNSIVISTEPEKTAHPLAPAVDAFREVPFNLSALFSTLNLVASGSTVNGSHHEKRQHLAEDCVVNNDI
jgi:CheY-like chemotaxis protein